MKKAITLLAGIFLMCFSANASTVLPENLITTNNYGQRYIFVERGVEFSIFPDGQFDFVYLGGNGGNNFSVQIGSPNVNISFNAGYNYDMYVQYDIYGAVIQIGNVPIYYDRYGRIIQAGNVNIYYNDMRLVRVGGLYVHYDRYGHYSHYTGFINSRNRHYVARPWHKYYVLPNYSHCIVYDYAYRKYYDPIRYSYSHHRKYYKRKGRTKHYNGRRDFYRPGSRVHYKNGRTALNEDYQPRKGQRGIDRNERRSRITTRRSDKSVVRSNAGRNENNRTPRSRSVQKRENDRNRTTGSARVRSTASREGNSQRSNARIISNSGNNKKLSIRRTSTQRKIRVAPKQQERVSANRSRSELRGNSVRSSSVKRKAASNRKTVKRAAPSRSKSTSARGGRFSRGGRR